MEYINFEHNETAAELVRAAYDTPPLAFVHTRISKWGNTSARIWFTKKRIC